MMVESQEEEQGMISIEHLSYLKKSLVQIDSSEAGPGRILLTEFNAT